MANKFLVTLIIGATSLTSHAQQHDPKASFMSNETLPVSNSPITKQADSTLKKSLWKFNLLGTLLNGINISYERKIATKWTLNINSVTNFQATGKNSSTLFGSSWALSEYQWQTVDFCQTLAMQVRYYHNLERRKRLGKDTDFSGNYFALEVSAGYNHFNYNNFYPFYPAYKGNTLLYSATLLYGIQRKIGKMGYIDCAVGVGVRHYQMEQYSETFFWPSVKLGVGIAF